MMSIRNSALPQKLPVMGISPQASRTDGRMSFLQLVQQFPHPFPLQLGCRGLVRSMSGLKSFFPESDLKPWQPASVMEEEDVLWVSYVAEDRLVDFYLGFFEALTEFYHERVFISVRTLAREIHLQIRFGR
jgi:hypothetical protein